MVQHVRHIHIHLQDASAATITKVKALYNRPGTSGEKTAAAAALKRMGVAKGEWEERKHPRDPGGKFSSASASKHGWQKQSENETGARWRHPSHPGHNLHTHMGGRKEFFHSSGAGHSYQIHGGGEGEEELAEHLKNFHNR